MSSKYASEKRRMVDRMNATSTLSLDVQAFQEVSSGLYQIGASLAKAATEAEFSDELARVTEGRARVVPGTYRQRGRVAVAHVAANRQSAPFDAAKHTELTPELANDSSGNLWAVVNVDGQKRVVAETSDDLAAIFQQRVANRRTVVPASEGAQLIAQASANGDFVTYVDAATKEVASGFAVRVDGGLQVLDRRDLTPRPVKDSQVFGVLPKAQLAARDRSAFPASEERASLTPDRVDAIISYLRKAYGPASVSMLDEYERRARAASF